MAKQKDNFIYFLVLLLFVGVAIIGYQWSDHALFEDAYKGPVADHQEWQDQKADGKPSVQPRPSGFRESDIKKQRGNRFNTW